MINQKGFIGIVVGLMITSVVLVGGGLYFYAEHSKVESLDAESVTTEQASENEEIATTKLIKDVEKVINCVDKNCFQSKFSKCEPATLKADIAFASAEYKIVEPANGGCKMTFKYTKNPNPEWVNKEMTCSFDNKIEFEKSFQNTFNRVVEGKVVCSGPFYTILRSM